MKATISKLSPWVLVGLLATGGCGAAGFGSAKFTEELHQATACSSTW
jgi:hypothetical protein